MILGLRAAHTFCGQHAVQKREQESGVESYRRRVRQNLYRIEQKVKKSGVDSSVEFDPRWTPVAGQILDRVSDVKADMVVVVAKSGKFASLFGGSVTRQILRTSRVPVLVIKQL